MLKLKYNCLVVLVLLPLHLVAQGVGKALRKPRPATESTILKNYTDSLSKFEDSIYNDKMPVQIGRASCRERV